MADQRSEFSVTRGGTGHPRVPPLQFLPAGCLSSKQSSIEVEDPPLDYSIPQESRESGEVSLGEGSNIIVFEKFTPKDGFPQEQRTVALAKFFKFPEDQHSKESLASLHRLMIQIEGESVSGNSVSTPAELLREQIDSLQLSSQSRGQDSLYSRMLTSELCSPSGPADFLAELQAEVETLKTSCARYEAQNQELRHEIHLSTSDILILDKTKREAVSELQAVKSQLAARNEDCQAIETLFSRLRTLLDLEEGEASQEPVAVRCTAILTEVEGLVAKTARFKALYEQSLLDSRTITELRSKLDQSERTVEDLRTTVSQRDKLISVLEDQMAVLRTAASKTASSGRNSSEACKRPELVKSASTSFHRSAPTFIHKGKTKEGKMGVVGESFGFSAYLIEDNGEEGVPGGTESMRTDIVSALSQDMGKRLGVLERSHPASESAGNHPPGGRSHGSSISPVPRTHAEQRQSLRWTSVSTQSRAPKFIAKGLERRMGESANLSANRGAVSSQGRKSMLVSQPVVSGKKN